MSTWLRYFAFWRRDPRLDADDEIGFHLEMRVRDLRSQGFTDAEAQARAREEFGNVEQVRQQVQRIDTLNMRRAARTEWWGELLRDARVGMRSLRNSPGFTVTAVLCAALGIGVTGAIVSAAYSILVRPLPYADADRLVAIYAENTVRGYRGVNISWPDFVSWRDQNRAFSGIGMWTWDTHTLSDARNDAERVAGAEVTANLFPILGVQPALGRLFLPGEDARGGNRVTLLSDGLWRRRFAADSAIVGKTITVDGLAYTVVGVMQSGFNFPERGDMWVPFIMETASDSHGSRGFAGAIGRMKGSVTFEQSVADLHRIDTDLAKQFPEENYGWRADVATMRDDLVGDLRQPLKVFLWAVGLVLLMVCANVANLSLARGATRAREIAVRSALGASRSRLGRQLITESLLVAAMGGVVGVAIAWWGVRLLRFAFPNQSPPFFVSLSLDGWALLFVAAIALLTGILCGLVPAFRGTKVDLNSALRDGSRGSGEGLHRSRLRSALVVGEVALSVMLMIGAILLVRSYQNLQRTDLGFDEKGILSARITLPSADYPTDPQVVAFYQGLFERLRRVPGVSVVGAAQGTPFSGWNVQGQAVVEGKPAAKRGEELISHFQYVTPEYFKAIGVGLVKGRWFTDADRNPNAGVVLINEQMARKAFGDTDPIGKRVRPAGPKSLFATVVGVVKDFRHYRLPQPMGPATYFPFATYPVLQQTIVMRTERGDPAALVPALRAAVREIDPRVAVYQVQTFEEVVSRSLWRQRLQGNVLGIFAVLSLALACIGLYGVISYAVAQRTRELGVRIALGATRANVLRLIFGQSGRLVVAGVALGLVGAYFGVRILETLLYGVQPNDAATFASVPALLSVVALVAAIIPARRATRVDPIIAMRAD